jgi:polyisoprenoid-binding protein YceI
VKKSVIALASAAIGVVSLGAAAMSVVGPVPAASAPIEAVALESSSTTEANVYTIDPSASEVRFVIDEVLRGEPFTVVGSTDQVAGQFALEASDTSDAAVGTILVNARTLETDDTSRNRAIQNFILNTGSFEYISFTPTAMTGLPSSVSVGETYAAQLTGDLTISGTTRPAAFEVSLTPVSSTQLVGSASSTINYADFGLSIPSVPFVASVDQDVRLELDFTANAA